MMYLDQLRKSFHSTVFETAARFTVAVGGGGATVWGVPGVDLNTGGGAPGYAKTTIDTTLPAFKVFTNSPRFYANWHLKTLGSVGSYYIGMGNVTAGILGHTFKDPHIGFKILVVGGVATLYASQADNATETAVALTAVVVNQVVEGFIQVNGGQNGTVISVDYYYRLDGGDWSAPVRLTGTLPTAAFLLNSTWCQVSCSNDGAALAQQEVIASSAWYSR